MSHLKDPVEVLEAFNVMLDEENVVEIQGVNLHPSYVLREMDPIAYQQELLNYLDILVSDKQITQELMDQTLSYYSELELYRRR